MSYNIFISHSWTYSNAYDDLKALLDKKPYFIYKDYSVPKDNPIHKVSTNSQLREAIKDKMIHASCVIILAGVYSTYSKWINIEIELAKELNKKIIAVEPWGAEKTSNVVKAAADKIVGWNTNSIVEAIRN